MKMGILQTELGTQPGELLIWFWTIYFSMASHLAMAYMIDQDFGMVET
jgi:hypothetical protein